MMVERYDQDAILAYVEGEMPEGDRRAFEAQMKQDEALHHLVSDLIADREALRNLPDVAAPSGMVDAAIGQIERSMLLDADPVAMEQTLATGPIPMSRATESPRRASTGRWLAYTGVAAAILISGGVMFQTLVGPDVFESRPNDGKTTLGMNEPRAEELRERRAARAERSRLAKAEDADDAVEEAVAPVTLAAKESADVAEAEPEAFADASDVLQESNEVLGRGSSTADTEGLVPTASAPPPKTLAMATKNRQAVSADARIEVVTRAPEQTRQQVMTWAISNSVDVLEDTPADEKVGRLNRQQVVLAVDESQIDELVDHLNAPVGQRANRASGEALVGGFAMLAAEAPAEVAGQVEQEKKDKRSDEALATEMFDLDWGLLLSPQVPLAPVQTYVEADEVKLAMPRRLVNVRVDVYTEQPSESGQANQPADVDVVEGE